jgi:hypothetical protein
MHPFQSIASVEKVRDGEVHACNAIESLEDGYLSELDLPEWNWPDEGCPGTTEEERETLVRCTRRPPSVQSLARVQDLPGLHTWNYDPGLHAPASGSPKVPDIARR